PDQLFRQIVNGAADSLAADETSLMLLEGDELRVVAACQPEPRSAVWQQPTRLGEGVAGLVAQTGTPALLNEGDDLSRFPNLIPKGDRIRSALSVPLEVGGRLVGVLNANRLSGGERFTQEDLAVLRLFAGTAALAIDQTSLLQRTQARSRSLETLLSIGEVFAGGAEAATALVDVMPRLGAAFHPSQAVAFLGSGADGGRLEAVVGWTPRGGTEKVAGTTGLRLAGEVAEAFARRAPAWFGGLPLEGEPLPWGSPPARCLIVPVADAHTESRCALVLGWEEPDFALSSEDLRVLDGLARQLELALSRQDRAAAAGKLETEIAQARTHLVEVERLATIGQSMAGMVHDINAPLTALITFAHLIQNESGEAKSRERAGQIGEAAQRAQRLVRELLTMARPRPPSFEAVDVHALLRSSMELERPQYAVSGVRLTADFAADLPRVMADPHRLGQVFTNLLVNARQAMDAAEHGSGVTVRTRRLDGKVEIRFADDGPGIAAAHRARIFDWFFTTKPPGEGTGLGLAVSREILVAHGGNLRLEDTPGGGATFVLELPLDAGGQG
ncbi:MAG TPA: ATP-binding protein, partial [Methylomirabilota bacterium]|nr:ATP-binding protein [Methylomirabilota bacterium]